MNMFERLVGKGKAPTANTPPPVAPPLPPVNPSLPPVDPARGGEQAHAPATAPQPAVPSAPATPGQPEAPAARQERAPEQAMSSPVIPPVAKRVPTPTPVSSEVPAPAAPAAEASAPAPVEPEVQLKSDDAVEASDAPAVPAHPQPAPQAPADAGTTATVAAAAAPAGQARPTAQPAAAESARKEASVRLPEPLTRGQAPVRLAELAAQADGKMEVRLRLDPPNLGEVRVHIESGDGRVDVRIVTATPEARAALTDGRANLRSELERQGVSLGSFSVGSEGSQQSAAHHHHAAPRPSMRSAAEGAPEVPWGAPELALAGAAADRGGLDARA
jgi:flagellar hook-length control protein FliK